VPTPAGQFDAFPVRILAYDKPAGYLKQGDLQNVGEAAALD
jgi:hypothetical protein